MPKTPGIARSRPHFLVATMLCAVVGFCTGCGSSDEKLSSGEADRALAALDSIQELVDDGRCKAAQRRLQVLITQASRVNDDRQDLGTAYAKSAERLQQLVERECVEIKETAPTDATSSTGETGVTASPEPTGSPEPPAPEPTDGGAAPPDTPKNNGNRNGNGNNGNGNSGDSGGAKPE